MSQMGVPHEASYTPRRGFLDDAEPAPTCSPRRALAEPNHVGSSSRGPRRKAPVRALLSRLILGREGGARRALVDPDAMLAAELVRLTRLDPRWGFLQSVREIDGITELDHWAIGPGGIYLLNAKHLPGSKLYVAGDRFLVDGRDEPFVPQMRVEAQKNSEGMSDAMHWDVGITGVIVPFNDRKLTVEHSPDDVAVIDEIDVAGWLVNRHEELSRRQIISAFAAARERSAWMPRFSR